MQLHCLFNFGPTLHFADKENVFPEKETEFIQGSKLFNSSASTRTHVSYLHYAFLFHIELPPHPAHLVCFKIICFSLAR